MRAHPAELRSNIGNFVERLANVTDAVVNVDACYKVHERLIFWICNKGMAKCAREITAQIVVIKK